MKPKRQSAGILLYRLSGTALEIFLVHPGGPFWKNKDAGTWTIPKGEFEESEAPLAAAQREFLEETGTSLQGTFLPLTPVLQKAGKLVHAWAIEGNIDAAAIRSNTFKVQWPPNSGQWQTFPEVDKAGWFSEEEAKEKINVAQIALIGELKGKLKDR